MVASEDGKIKCMPCWPHLHGPARRFSPAAALLLLALLCMISSCALQREILRQVAVLSDRLYMGIRAEQVMPGASAAKRPDAAHWKTVLVRSQLFCLLAAEAHDRLSSK